MDLRTRITAATKQAMKNKDATRLSTLRLISAAIKDRDIAARGEGAETGVPDSEILSILQKMVKQRQESARTYEEGGRLDLAEQEQAEIEVIEEFLPKRMSEAEVDAAVDEAVAEIGANSIRDMGRVMGVLKTKYAGRMDFGAARPKGEGAPRGLRGAIACGGEGSALALPGYFGQEEGSLRGSRGSPRAASRLR